MRKSILHTFFLLLFLDTFLPTPSTISNVVPDVNVGIKDCRKKDGIGCLGFSDGCIERNDCSILTTYQPRKSGDVTFTISGIIDINQYLALSLIHI